MNVIQLPLDGQVTDLRAAALWQQLRALRFDRGTGPRTFAVRLAQEQGWPAAYAARAIEEYRRFLLLFALSEHAEGAGADQPARGAGVRIVPPAAVDKVWHLHLLYTHSYWDDLCRGILGTPLHHLPAEGAGGDAVALDKVYRQTLASYRRVFGAHPPADIWPGGAPLPRPVAPAQPVAPPVTLAKSTVPSSRLAAPMPWGWRVFWAASVVGMIILVLAEAGWSFGAVGAVLFKGCLVAGAGWTMVLISRARQENARHRARGRGGAAHNAGDGCGWNFDLFGDSGSSHDGGHSHSCGGHGCGGHGCGGGGCGGGGH